MQKKKLRGFERMLLYSLFFLFNCCSLNDLFLNLQVLPCTSLFSKRICLKVSLENIKGNVAMRWKTLPQSAKVMIKSVKHPKTPTTVTPHHFYSTVEKVLSLTTIIFSLAPLFLSLSTIWPILPRCCEFWPMLAPSSLFCASCRSLSRSSMAQT